ncbi:hypothetical protein NCS54_00435000 [Fusarium falciforme]|uniref:uncharacterized protein n=1 Tax=Fusarium falciforme TaxID=195108 RepID=UPI0023016223|nr:uncharacterized protein NCS54_00435000 [Fusarium falciforme]WAO87055.1 hypothetical protein NCS54_00435000 [Fusarium falciforme]
MVLPLRTTPNEVEDLTDRIETETDNYITDFAAREVLITEWDQLRRSRIPARYFTPTATAILMIAPLDILQDLLQSYVPGDRIVIFHSIHEDNPTPCILMGRSRFLGTSRLFPRMGNDQQEIHHIQSILEVFWGEKAPSWIATFTNPDFVESPQNHISLNFASQSSFDDARLAFKPIRSADPNERRLQLHWLKPSAFRIFNSYFYDNPLQHAGLDAENTKTWGDR